MGEVSHFVFLVETSSAIGAMGADRSFSVAHGDILDTLMSLRPDALVSCLTFDTEAYTEYVAMPIRNALTLTMRSGGKGDLTAGIWKGLWAFIQERPKTEDITVIIVTAGDASSCSIPVLESVLSAMRGRGVRFLYCVVRPENWLSEKDYIHVLFGFFSSPQDRVLYAETRMRAKTFKRRLDRAYELGFQGSEIWVWNFSSDQVPTGAPLESFIAAIEGADPRLLSPAA